jgi:hypothetical protein
VKGGRAAGVGHPSVLLLLPGLFSFVFGWGTPAHRYLYPSTSITVTLGVSLQRLLGSFESVCCAPTQEPTHDTQDTYTTHHSTRHDTTRQRWC